MKSKQKLLAKFMLAGICINQANAQTSSSHNERGIIQTSFPSLLVVPEARTGAMGEAGAATTPDANPGIYNAAKFAFADAPTAFSNTVSESLTVFFFNARSTGSVIPIIIPVITWF